MRRIVITAAATVTIVVLLFSYRTSTNQQLPPVATGRAPGLPPVTSPPTASTTPNGTGRNGTFTGNAVNTRFGPVQVQITVSDGKITSAQAVQVPHETSRDVRINSAAVPVLIQETLQAQSAQIDTVSGATYTSDGYAQSLQSAIDAARQ
jgi:uncharacterized protein with FMN-binding domain